MSHQSRKISDTTYFDFKDLRKDKSTKNVKNLLSGLKKYIGLCILAPLLKLAEATLDLIVPLIVQNIIDIGIAARDTSYIINHCILLVILAIVGLAFSVSAQYFAAKAAVYFASDVRHNLYEHIQKFSYKDLDKIGTSTLITRMTSDIEQVQKGVNICLRLLLRAPFIVVGSTVIAIGIDRQLSLIFIVIIAILFLVVFLIYRKLNPLYRKTQENLDDVTLHTSEHLEGTRVIRALRIQNEQNSQFNDKNNQLFTVQKNSGILSALIHPVTFVLINLAIIALLYFSGIKVNVGRLTQGNVVALYNLLSSILQELIRCAKFIMILTRSVACGARVQKILDAEPSMTFNDTVPDTKNSDVRLEFENVSVNYLDTDDEQSNALTDISFTAKKGETIGIIGGTGSGKTTLINLIARYYDCSRGIVKVDNIDVKDYPEDVLRKKVAVVPQKAVLFQGSLRENLEIVDEKLDDERLEKCIKIAQAQDVVSSRADGLDSIIDQGGKNFSGGQRQRLTVARALVKVLDGAEILVLDDSSSALDMATDKSLRQAIKENQGDCTVLLISQRASTVMSCDKIIVLDDGRCVGVGKHEDLMKSCDVYREIYNCKQK